MPLWFIITELWIRAVSILAELWKHGMAGRFLEYPTRFFISLFRFDKNAMLNKLYLYVLSDFALPLLKTKCSRSSLHCPSSHYLVFPLAQNHSENRSLCFSLKLQRFSWKKTRWKHKNLLLMTCNNRDFENLWWFFSLAALCNFDPACFSKIDQAHLETMTTLFCFIHCFFQAL